MHSTIVRLAGFTLELATEIDMLQFMVSLSSHIRNHLRCLKIVVVKNCTFFPELRFLYSSLTQRFGILRLLAVDNHPMH